MIEVNLRSYDVISAALPKDMKFDQPIGEPLVVELDEGAKIVDIFNKLPWLGRPYEDTILVFINGQAETLMSELKSGDTIDILTPSGGG